MSTLPNEPTLDGCGCCETQPATPAIFNRPRQPALAYRIGVYESFQQRMLGGLGSGPLRALTTRSVEDPSIALLDAWACVADVLTFYQERIANEGFLRTATERRSVLELARAIGYELRPGVAAATFLAFTIESAPGSPRVVNIVKGTRVQSLPVAEQLPQTFETVEDIVGRAEWNGLRPKLSKPQDPGLKASRIYLQGIALNLKAGDLLLLVSGDNNLARRIVRATPDFGSQETVVELEPAADSAKEVDRIDTPGSGVPSLNKFSFDQDTILKQIVQKKWREADLQTMIANQGWNPDDVAIAAVGAANSQPAKIGVLALRTQANVFGHNAPSYMSLPDTPTGERKTRFGESWDSGWSIWKDQSGGADYEAADFYLDRVETSVVSGDWLVLDGLINKVHQRIVHQIKIVTQGSLAGFAMSGRATGLVIKRPIDKPKESFLIRSTTVYTQSEALPLATVPIDDPIQKGTSTLTLDSMTLGLTKGQRLALSGELSDTPGVSRREIIVLKEITHQQAHTTLEFQDPLASSYARKTVTLNANVARATHGETVQQEVLGSGDGAAANQRFTLSHAPLTFVSAQTPSGVESTLDLRTNDVLWTETASLFFLGPRTQNYAVRIDDDANATLIFGDGTRGARLPGGTENVVATYRTGIGPDGEVGADRLILLANPPLGVRSVTNPLAASGADGPEKLDKARDNAPRTVLTLDRVVSLTDFEAFAGSFAGIGKTKAAILWKRESRRVHITLAGAAGQPVDPSSDLYGNLLSAIAGAGDISATVDVGSYQRRTFSLEASLLVDPRYLAAKVLAAADAAVRDAFSFGRRNFAQGVSAAEVVRVLQAVPGVIACDLDRLFLSDDSLGRIQTEPAPFLAAAAARWPESGAIQPAQLLLVDSSGVVLKEMKP